MAPTSGAEREIGRLRNRSKMPLVKSSSSPDAGAHRGEDHGLHEQRRAARTAGSRAGAAGDRAAEDEDEQQRKMIGWNVTSSSASGVDGPDRCLRQASVPLCRSSAAAERPSPVSPARARSVGGVMAVVMRRPPRVGRRRVGRSGSGTPRPGSAAAVPARRRAMPASSSRPTDRGSSDAGRHDRHVSSPAASTVGARAGPARRRSRTTRSRSRRVSRAHVQRCPPTWALSSAGVPAAMTRPWSKHRRARRPAASASSRYCVVSSTVAPSATSARTSSQTSLRLCGSRPVVGSSRYSTSGGRPGSRPGRAAGASRRSTSWPAVRGVGQVEPLQQFGGARAGASRRDRSSSRPISTRFSGRTASSSTAAYCPVRPISARTGCGVARPRRTRRPWRARRPGRSSVARMRTAVVLPAPFGPSTPSTVPRRTARSTPSSARVAPKS